MKLAAEDISLIIADQQLTSYSSSSLLLAASESARTAPQQ
jgi:hypothetical protein